MSNAYKVYACGGTGVNQVAGVEPSWLEKMNVSFADCSTSDTKAHGITNAYLFKGIQKTSEDDIDGSGKKRGENIEIIRPQMPAFFKDHPPAKVNILVCSDSGGTGAVIMHLIASHLTSLGLPFVVLLTGSQGSLIECENGIKTMKGLNQLGLKNKIGVPVVYQNNHRENSTSSGNDKQQQTALVHLTRLLSGSYHGLDGRDVHNFFRPTESTAFEGGLLELFCRVGDLREEEANSTVLSVLSIVPELDDVPTSLSAEYAAHGCDASVESSVHFTLGTENIVNIIGFMEAALVKKEEERLSRLNVTKNLFNDKSTADDDDDLFL